MKKDGKIKILVACPPLDGHFTPLTGLAMHLKLQGYDVRWYTGQSFSKKIEKLGIQHYEYDRAIEVNQYTMEELYPERKHIKSTLKNLEFALLHIFLLRAPEHFEDLKDISKVFPFDVLLCDSLFFAGRLFQHVMKVPTVAIGVSPLALQQQNLAPYGMGLPPSNTPITTAKYAFLQIMVNRVFFRKLRRQVNEVNSKYGLPRTGHALFDHAATEPAIYLQNGVPGFDYPRIDLPQNIHFVGALQPYKNISDKPVELSWLEEGENAPVVLVSQGTFEPDHRKLTIPTLEALKDSGYLIVVATAYNDTEHLRRLYPQKNIIIEDYIDFDLIMPRVDLFVTNGGYGSVMQAIRYGLPMVCAGIHEGKSEICARVEYCDLGVNLETESPGASDLGNAVNKVLNDPLYRAAVSRVQKEFTEYDTMALCEQHIQAVLKARLSPSTQPNP